MCGVQGDAETMVRRLKAFRMEFRRLCLIEDGTVNSVVPSSSSSASALADLGLAVDETSPLVPSLV